MCVPVAQTKVPKPMTLITDDFMSSSKYLVSVAPDLHFPNIKSIFSVLKLKQNAFPLEWDASWEDKIGNSKSWFKYCKHKHKYRVVWYFLIKRIYCWFTISTRIFEPKLSGLSECMVELLHLSFCEESFKTENILVFVSHEVLDVSLAAVNSAWRKATK